MCSSPAAALRPGPNARNYPLYCTLRWLLRRILVCRKRTRAICHHIPHRMVEFRITFNTMEQDSFRSEHMGARGTSTNMCASLIFHLSTGGVGCKYINYQKIYLRGTLRGAHARIRMKRLDLARTCFLFLDPTDMASACCALRSLVQSCMYVYHNRVYT